MVINWLVSLQGSVTTLMFTKRGQGGQLHGGIKERRSTNMSWVKKEKKKERSFFFSIQHYIPLWVT
jgi:hypothetical protein